MPMPPGVENHKPASRLLIAAGVVPLIAGCHILQFPQQQETWEFGLARFLIASTGGLNRQVDLSFAFPWRPSQMSLPMKNGAQLIPRAFFGKKTSERYCIFGSGL